MRILIVGCGIAGLTLAALLKQRGIEAVMIEKAENFHHTGYMLGLVPAGSRVLHGLGLYAQFEALSQAQTHYGLYTGQGKLINHYSFKAIIDQYGPMRNLMRGDLLQLLESAAQPQECYMGTTIQQLVQHPDKVVVSLSNHKTLEFDLVVGADGIHSQLRELVFAGNGVKQFDTGWGAWLWFTENAHYPHHETREYWGTGQFFGIYPVQGKLGIIAAMPNEHAYLTAPHNGRQAMLQDLCQNLGKGIPDSILSSVPADGDNLFYWKLKDVRCKEWSQGRVVLLGDAADAFLPTAGLGASMAMESAAVLNDELSRVDAAYIHNAIAWYCQRRQSRVEAAQTTSRALAKIMFQKSGMMAAARNYSMRFYKEKQFNKSFLRLLEQVI